MSKPRVIAISKSTLREYGSRPVIMDHPEAMAISHYAYVGQSTSATIPFVIEGVGSHATFIKPTEFAISIRQKVDLSASGVNDTIIKENGIDVGKYDYKNISPSVPVDLPPGFKEVYRKE